MADPVQGVLDVLAKAERQVDSADWSKHDRLIEALVEAVSTVYLRTGRNGLVYDRILPGVDAIGSIPAIVDPLVTMLEAQASELDGNVVKFERPAWDRFLKRLAEYRGALDQAAAAPNAPSEIVWERVTLPLAAGIYPDDFSELGIVNPEVRSPPDVVYTATVAFQIALFQQAMRDRWRLLFQDLADNARAVLGSIVDAAIPVGILLLAGAAVLGGVAILKQRQ